MSDYPWRPGSAGSEPETPGQESMGERLESMSQRAGEAARQAEQRTRRLREDISQGAHRARQMAAAGLSWAANTLRSSAPSDGSTARQFADNLERGATYLRETDLAGMRRDALGLAKQYPGPALGAAFVVGFLLGRRLSRD